MEWIVCCLQIESWLVFYLLFWKAGIQIDIRESVPTEIEETLALSALGGIIKY